MPRTAQRLSRRGAFAGRVQGPTGPQVAFVQAAANGAVNTPSFTVTLPANATAGNAVVLTIQRYTQTVSTISGLGASWRQLYASAADGNGVTTEVWIGTGVTGGSATITVLTSGNTYASAHASEFSGVKSYGTVAGASVTGTTLTSPAQNAISGDMTYVAFNWMNTATASYADTGAFTSLTAYNNTNVGDTVQVGYHLSGGTESPTRAITLSASKTMVAVSLILSATAFQAPTYISQSSQIPNSTGVTTPQTVVVTPPPNLMVGNLLLAVIYTGTNQKITSTAVPTGWTMWNLFTPASNANGSSVMVCYKYVDATDLAAANYTFSMGAGSAFQYNLGAVILQYANAALGAAMDQQASIKNGNGGTSVPTTAVAPSITPSMQGTLELAIFAMSGAATISSVSPNLYVARASGGAGNSGGNIDIRERALTSATATGDITGTLSGSAYDLGVHVSIKPYVAPTFAVRSTLAAGSNTNVASKVFTLSTATVAGDTILVFLQGLQNSTVTGLSGCGATWTKLARTTEPVGTSMTEVWVGTNCAPGQTTFTTTFGTTSSGTEAFAICLSGVSKVLNTTSKLYTAIAGSFASPSQSAIALGQVIVDMIFMLQSTSTAFTTPTDTPGAFVSDLDSAGIGWSTGRKGIAHRVAAEINTAEARTFASSDANQRATIISVLLDLIQGYFDLFDRPDSSTSLGVTSDGLFTWNPVLGTWGISSGQASRVTTSGTRDIATIPSPLSDGIVTVKLPTISGAPGVSFRVQDGSNLLAVFYQSGTLYLSEIVGGSATLRLSTAHAVSAGDEIGVKFNGTAISTLHNGLVVASATNSNFVTQKNHGLYENSGGGTPQWENFKCLSYA